jgi:hypothetical protein
MVGCVTPHASAARPKCRSLASASNSSSLSIKKQILHFVRQVIIITTAAAGPIRQNRRPIRVYASGMHRGTNNHRRYGGNRCHLTSAAIIL